MSKNSQMTVLKETIRVQKVNQDDCISLTDIAKFKNSDDPRFVIQNWMRSRSSVEFIGIWGRLYNPSFNRVEFDTVRNESGSNAFMIMSSKVKDQANAARLVCLASLKSLSAMLIEEEKTRVAETWLWVRWGVRCIFR